MYDIIKRYVDNENKNGLMLIDMPTGSGKTYSAIKYIFDACMDPQNKDRKYIFVTTLKKNLPYDDLQKWFNSIGKSELYQEKVLVIDSNMDSVVDGWSPEVESAIPAEIKKSDEYKNFQRDLSFVKRQREEKTLVMREFLDSIESNLREKTEPRFRRLVSDYLAKEYVTVEQRLYAVKTDKKWQWLGKLYPAVFTRDRQVLFLSMDKLLSRNTTIVEPSYMFYNSDIVKSTERLICNWMLYGIGRRRMMERPHFDIVASGARMRAIRQERKISVKQVMEYMGFESTQAVYKWEAGKCFPQADNLIALAILYRVSPMELLVEEDLVPSSSHIWGNAA